MPKVKVPKITHAKLKELLDYDPDTGIFTCRTNNGNRWKIGDPFGHLDATGYTRVWLGEAILAHRLAWFYVHGVWPSNQIDHINRDRNDNRIANLRDVSCAVNSRNRKACGRVPLLGVVLSRSGMRFKAQITIDRKTRHIGSFKTAEEAHQAYLSAQPKI